MEKVILNILVISLWYSPEPVAKPHDLAKGLVLKGHKVTVITSFPNYPKGKIYEGYRNHLFRVEIINGVKVIRIVHFINRSLSVPLRVLSYLSFSINAIICALWLKNEFDLIWTYQIGLPGAILSLLKRIPFVHEVQDLWPEWAVGITGKVKKFIFNILKYQELYIYRKASKIITISDGFASILQIKGVPKEKIIIIPNWADESCFYPSERNENIRIMEKFNNKFRVMYIGNIGTAQQLENVIWAATLIKQNDIEIVFIGDGVERPKLEYLAKMYSLSNIRFLGIRPQSVINQYIAFADVLLIHLGKNPIYDMTIPSKTLGYLAAGKPILAVCRGETADLIKKINAGLVCEPGEPSSLAKKLIDFSKLPKEDLILMGKKGREYYFNHLSKNILLNKYNLLFNTLALVK